MRLNVKLTNIVDPPYNWFTPFIFVINETVFIVVIGLLCSWIGAVSFLLFSMIRHYRLLTQGANGKRLDHILEKQGSELTDVKNKLQELQKDQKELFEHGEGHLQKIGVVRFNPFNDTGGEQSFSIALLDAKDTGVVISILFSRMGSRTYVKRIINGKGKDNQLSEEEQKAVAESKKRSIQ